jgi:hypothetical protein
MNKTLVFYMDEQGNEAEPAKAVKGMAAEYDEQGNLLWEVWFVRDKENKGSP